MSEWRLVRSAVWREVYSRRKAFVITSALALVVVLGGISAAALVAGNNEPFGVEVGVVGGPTDDLEDEIAKRLDPSTDLQVISFQSPSAGESALRSGEVHALVLGPHDVLWGPSTPYGVTEAVASAMFAMNLERAASQMGVGNEDLEELLSVTGQTIDSEESDESVEILAVISVIVMFIAILSYGQWIAYGVLEEKANRVAELILGALSPAQLLTAKMLSLGGMGLVQLIVVCAAAFVAGTVMTDFALPAVTASTLLWLVGWFILGFAFYGSLYAASGSLAEDTQEAGAIITPLNILPGAGYVVGVIAFSAGSEAVPRILSMIPFFAPMVMPGRIAQGSATGWEVAFSVGLMMVSTVVMIRFAGRVYVGGISQATRQVGWRQAFRGGEDLARSRG